MHLHNSTVIRRLVLVVIVTIVVQPLTVAPVSKPLHYVHDGDPESLSSHGSPDVHRERSRLTDSGTYETTVSTSLNAYQTTLLCIVLLLSSIMAEAKRLLGVATSRSFSDDHGRQRCHYRILP